MIPVDEKAKIEIKNLSYWYGVHRALEDVTITIPESRVTAIIGPSGCGKSTLIKAVNRIGEVAGEVRIEGDVQLDGASVYGKEIDLVDLRRRVGMVFQKPNPFPQTIHQNVAFGPRLHGVTSRATLDEIVERSLRDAALWDEVKDRLHQSAYGISGGQQQRLCIARALAVDPEVILMDEPCSALDPIATARIEELMQDLKKHYTLVIVTHNMQQASRVADYTAFLYLGRLIEFGDTERMFIKPMNKQTEDYITGRFG